MSDSRLEIASVVDQVYGVIRERILTGALPRGARVHQEDVAADLGVSRTPVREALRQLAASGLVDARAHRGAVVARPSLDRLTGMFEAMAELEAICAGLAAERMTPVEALNRLHELVERARRG